jgi:hypothetical protein
VYPGIRHLAYAAASALLGLLCAVAPAAAEEAAPRAYLRPLAARIQRIMATSVDRSPTLRMLVEALEDTNVIVYLETYVPDAARQHGGDLRLAAATGGVRYLRIGLSNGLNDVQMTAMLAHELQHAIEVATHAHVCDQASLRALYEQIGVRVRTDRYETPEAIRVAERVTRELRANRAAGRAPPDQR